MRSSNKSYIHLGESGHELREDTPWYWRLVALVASWMILGGFLLLSSLYAKKPDLKFTTSVLTVFVVALLTAGYSFTALLCFACRNQNFQAEGVFLPALTSSAFGLLSIVYNLLSSNAYAWEAASISGTVISAAATLLYGTLFLWTNRRMTKSRNREDPRPVGWAERSEPAYYANFIQNMYPTVTRSPSRAPETPLTEDDGVNQQMALLLTKQDSRPSPDPSSTFRIDLPGMREEEERRNRSQELVGTPGPAHMGRPGSLGEQQAWERWKDRGRSTNRAVSAGGRSNHSRNLSREERRREIELGHP